LKNSSSAGEVAADAGPVRVIKEEDMELNANSCAYEVEKDRSTCRSSVVSAPPPTDKAPLSLPNSFRPCNGPASA